MVTAFTREVRISARVFQTLWKRHRQLAGGIYLTEKDTRQSLAYCLTDEELFYYSPHMIQPRAHNHGIPVTQYYYNALLYPGYSLNQTNMGGVDLQVLSVEAFSVVCHP